MLRVTDSAWCSYSGWVEELVNGLISSKSVRSLERRRLQRKAWRKRISGKRLSRAVIKRSLKGVLVKVLTQKVSQQWPGTGAALHCSGEEDMSKAHKRRPRSQAAGSHGNRRVTLQCCRAS